MTDAPPKTSWGRAALLTAALLAAATPAAADTIALANGGTVKGTVLQLVFLHRNAEETLHCGQFAGVRLDVGGTDRLQPASGEEWTGELLSLQVQSAGGVLTFKRPQLAAITLELPDSIQLANGGTVTGIVQNLVLRKGTERTTLPRGDLRSVRIDPQGRDTVKRSGGETSAGTVESMRILSAVGLRTFRRTEFTAATVLLLDTVTLKTGARLSGTVEQVVLTQGDTRRTFRRSGFAGIGRNSEGEDTVRLAGGGREAGRIASLRIQVAGRMLAVSGDELAEVVVRETAQDELRKAFRQKRAQIKDGDAAALLALASWCKDHDLEPEARGLAEKVLASDPDPKTAVLAHQLLGHVLRDGRWSEPGAAPPGEEPAARTADPALVAAARDIYKEFAGKVDAAKKQDAAAVKNKYGAAWKAIFSAVKTLDARIDALKRVRSRLRDRIRDRRSDLRGYKPDLPVDYDDIQTYEELEDLRRRLSHLGKDLDILEDFLKPAKLVRSAFGRIIKARVGGVSKRDRERKQKLTTARYKVERLLLHDKDLTQAGIRAAFEELLKDSFEPIELDDLPQPKIDFRSVIRLAGLGDRFRRRAYARTQKDRKGIDDDDGDDYDNIREAISRLEASIRSVKRRASDLERDIAREEDDKRRERLQEDLEHLEASIRQYERSIDSRERSARRVLNRIRTDLARARRRANDRDDKINAAWERAARQLRLGKDLSDTEMQDLFERALKDD